MSSNDALAVLQTFSETELGRGADILIHSDRIFVGDRIMDPHVIVYDSRGHLVQRFGATGQGPGEMLDPTALSVTTDGRLAIFDSPRQSVHFFANTGDAYRYDRTQRLDASGVATQVIVSGSTVAASLMGGAVQLIPYEAGNIGRPARTAGEPPWQRERVSVPAEVQRAYAAMDPNGQRVAIVYLGYPEVQLMEVSGISIARISSPELADETTADGEFVRYYRDVYATQERVYALYCGCAEQGALTRSVHVFTWDGELETVLDLGGAQVYSIAASADDLVLYGSVDRPEPVIRTWAMPR